MINTKNAAKAERARQRSEAGLVSEHFPSVAAIVVNMSYNQKGMQSILRTLNFFPSSHAFLKADCLSRDCVDGGFDLTRVITTMVRSKKKAAKGELICEGNDPSGEHSSIVYEITIQYT